MPPPAPPVPWKFEALRLPRALEEAEASALQTQLLRQCRELWRDGVRVPTVGWTEALAKTLANARRAGHLVQGLERAQRALELEARGLSMADERKQKERGSRVSRLLLTSNDGAERFYRQVERLLRTQGLRLLAVRVEVDSATLGAVVGADKGLARALLVEHKSSAAAVLRSLLVTRPPA